MFNLARAVAKSFPNHSSEIFLVRNTSFAFRLISSGRCRLDVVGVALGTPSEPYFLGRKARVFASLPKSRQESFRRLCVFEWMLKWKASGNTPVLVLAMQAFRKI